MNGAEDETTERVPRSNWIQKLGSRARRGEQKNQTCLSNQVIHSVRVFDRGIMFYYYVIEALEARPSFGAGLFF